MQMSSLILASLFTLLIVSFSTEILNFNIATFLSVVASTCEFSKKPYGDICPYSLVNAL